MCVCVLAAPGSVPSGQAERLEAQAQVCDARRGPGRRHLLGAGHASAVGEEHPPAAHRSQLRLFSVQDPVQRCITKRRERSVRRLKKSVCVKRGEKSHTKLRRAPIRKTTNPSLISESPPTLSDGGANLLPLCSVKLPCISVRITDPPSSM